MITLLLKGSEIVAASADVQTIPVGYQTPDGIYPTTAGITGTATVDALPADFAINRYEWVGGALVRLPDPPPAPSPIRNLPPLAFLDLFTDDEQLAITTAAGANAAVDLWYRRAIAAQDIDLDSPRTVAGLDALVAAGLLTSGRRDRILMGLPPA